MKFVTFDAHDAEGIISFLGGSSMPGRTELNHQKSQGI
jgi:hypothetical protein